MKIDIEAVIAEEQLDEQEAAWLRAQPAEAAYLVSKDVAFVGTHHEHEWPAGVAADACAGQPHWPVLCINVNDTFCYACGDAEDAEPKDLPELVQIYRQHGWVGLVCWVAKRRGYDPVIEFTEDPVYQSTWRALYGDTKVVPSPLADERWGDDRLNLQPWEPITEDA